MQQRWRPLRVALALALWGILVVGAPPVAAQTADSRRRGMMRMRSSNDVVFLDDSNFDLQVTSGPRQYDVVVFFTANDPKLDCKTCLVMGEQFLAAAASYRRVQKSTPEDLRGAEIFFVVADFSRLQQAFAKLKLTQVPKIVHFPPQLSPSDGAHYVIGEGHEMPVKGNTDANAIARFIRDRTGAVIRVQQEETSLAFIVFVLVVMAALAIVPVVQNIKSIVRLVHNRWLWLLVSLSFYTFSISGGVYDIIRSPPAFHLNPHTKSIMWINPQSNQQFVAEGFIVGTLNLLMGMCVVGMLKVAPRQKEKTGRMFWALLFSVLFCYIYWQVMGLYRQKNRWYMSRPLA